MAPENMIWPLLGRCLIIIITHDYDFWCEKRSFLIEILLFYLLLKTSIHCTFPYNSKAKNCQVILSYVNKNQSSPIMKAAYNMLCCFLWNQVLPQLFSFWIWLHLITSPFPPVVTQLCEWEEQLHKGNIRRTKPVPTSTIRGACVCATPTASCKKTKLFGWETSGAGFPVVLQLSVVGCSFWRSLGWAPWNI